MMTSSTHSHVHSAQPPPTAGHSSGRFALILTLAAAALFAFAVFSFTLRPAPEIDLDSVGADGEVAISFRADTAAVWLPGACLNVSWDVTNAVEVALNGSPVLASGVREVCPSADAPPTLSLVLPGGATRDYPLNVIVLAQHKYFLLAVVGALGLLAGAVVFTPPAQRVIGALHARASQGIARADGQVSTTALLLRTEQILRFVLLAIVALYLVLYLGVALARIGYPFELEWMEGASVDSVSRVLNGQPLYAAPGVEYVAPIYGPIYFYASALVSMVFGVGFFPLRLVSLLASLGCFAVIYGFVKRETGDRFAAVLGAGLFAATFDATGSWFDLARVDSLYLFLLLLGLYLVRFHPSPRGYIAAGIVLSLSLLTKQTALVTIAFILLYCLLSQPRYTLYLLAAMALLIGGSTLLYDFATNGWYSYFMLDMAEEQGIVGTALLGFWQGDLAVLLLAVLLMLVVIYRQLASQSFIQARFYALLAVGMLIASWLMRLHSGGWVNGLFPAYAALALFLGLGVSLIVRLVRDLPIDRRSPVVVALYLACLVQFVGLLYDPSPRIPTEQDRQAGSALIQHLSRVEGDILFVGHGYYAALAGKPGYQFGWSMNVLGGSSSPNALALTGAINDAIAQQRFGVIVADNATFLHEDFEAALETYYEMELLPYVGTEFLPVTGMETRPTYLYTPKSSPG